MQKNATTICIQKYGFGCAGRYLQYGYYHDGSWIVSHFLNGEEPKVGGRGWGERGLRVRGRVSYHKQQN